MQSAMYNLSGHETNKYYLLDNNREDSYQRTHQLQVKKDYLRPLLYQMRTPICRTGGQRLIRTSYK